jgi:hypothetical protein
MAQVRNCWVPIALQIPIYFFTIDGLISSALKENKIKEALEQVSEYSVALNMAKMMTNEKDTLILSMSDLGSSAVYEVTLRNCVINFSIGTYLCRLFSKRPKTIFVLRKNQLCHKGNRMKIADFYVARKWF